MVVKGYRVGPLLKKTAREVMADGVSSLAAQTAYYFFFSLFPLLLFVAPLASLVADKQKMISLIMTRVGGALPSEAIAPVKLVLDNVVFSKDAPGLVSIGALLALWSGANIYGALMTALNTAYDVDETRPWWKQQVIKLVMVVVGSVMVVLATLVLLGGEDVARTVGGWLGLAPATIRIWNIVQFPLAFAFIVFYAALGYWLLPNAHQKKRHALVGGALVSVLWLLATLLFRLYVQRFPPNPTYGVIGGIMILLTWMYYTMFVLLAVGELMSELHHGTGAIEPPKGATYFGRIVAGDHPGEASTAH